MTNGISRLVSAAASVATDPLALPYFAKGDNPQLPALLMIHGFTGNPGELRYAGERFHAAGYTVSIPRLPGHGSSGIDFLKTGAHDWLRRGCDALQDLHAQSDSVVVMGLSMGALLATLLSDGFNTQATVLCAPAFIVNQPMLPLTPWLGRIVPSYRVSYDPERIAPEFRPLASRYRSRRWVRGAGHLYVLQNAARRSLVRLRSPVYTVLAKDDPTVPATKVGELLERSLTHTTHDLRVFDSKEHVLLNGDLRDEVIDHLIDRLAQLPKHSFKPG